MLVSRSTLRIAFFAALTAAPLGAQQDKGKDEKSDEIPKSALPPRGLCRVWLNGVAASQQPAPTDCTSAIRNLPQNSRLMFGDMRGVTAKEAKSLPVTPFNGAPNAWAETRRGGIGRMRGGDAASPAIAGSPQTRAAQAPGAPSQGAPSQNPAILATPASARAAATVAPSAPPPPAAQPASPPAKPAAKPEFFQ